MVVGVVIVRWSMSHSRVIPIAIVAAVALAATRPAVAKPYTLAELVDMARRGNPGIMAGAAATTAMEAQVNEAKRNWYPSGDLLSFVAPISCTTMSVVPPPMSTTIYRAPKPLQCPK